MKSCVTQDPAGDPQKDVRPGKFIIDVGLTQFYFDRQSL